MTTEKISIGILVILTLSGFIWSAFSFLSISTANVPTVKNTPANFAAFKAAELPDKCQTPPGYTDQEWTEHMSHHPDQYQECFTL